MTSFLGSVYRSKAPLEISVDEGPEVVMVESTGLASMYQGMVLGEYYRLEDHCRAACYAQSHSDLGEAPVYLYKSERDGAWYVDSQLDSVSGKDSVTGERSIYLCKDVCTTPPLETLSPLRGGR